MVVDLKQDILSWYIFITLEINKHKKYDCICFKTILKIHQYFTFINDIRIKGMGICLSFHPHMTCLFNPCLLPISPILYSSLILNVLGYNTLLLLSSVLYFRKIIELAVHTRHPNRDFNYFIS